MSEPKRQHLVPRCYLKNFALKQRKDWFLDAYNIRANGKKIFNINIENICVEKDFYTFHDLEEKDRRFLERLYSKTVEADYTEVYSILTKPGNTRISDNQRFKIISYIISQHFRTAKLFNALNNLWNGTLERAHDLAVANSLEKKLYYEDNKYIDLENRPLLDRQDEFTRKNRELANLKSYLAFKNLTLKRLNDAIFVNKVYPGHRLITSDTPVTMGGLPFNPSVSIHLPIDPLHVVTLIPPNDRIEFDLKRIEKVHMDEELSYLKCSFYNSAQIEQCEKFILGSRTAILQAIEIHESFNIDEFNSRCERYTRKTTEETEAIETMVKNQTNLKL